VHPDPDLGDLLLQIGRVADEDQGAPGEGPSILTESKYRPPDDNLWDYP